MERRLTYRQREILRLFAKGLSTKEVAAELGIRETMVNNDAYHARAKLMGLTGKPVRSRGEAVAVALEQGIIE